MAALTTQSANDLINYITRNVAPSWDGATTLYLSLHTGAVGTGGDQTTSEVAYTGYARLAMARNAGGDWTAAASGATENNAQLTFGLPTAGSFPINATHVGLGENASGAGTVIAGGALASTIVINLNVQVNFNIGTIDMLAA